MLKKEKNNKKKEIIGCIADDFTGAADVCSFLVREGAKVLFLNNIPKTTKEIEAEVIVVALKIRTEDKTIAINKVKETLDFFDKINVTRVFYKYCSTFDSSSEGNIGPILDYMLEAREKKYTVVSPALPENNREVFNGYLFADGTLLSEGSMASHPLTPMKDSNLVRLLNAQSKYEAHSLNHRMINDDKFDIYKFINDIKEKKFYIIPDYYWGLDVDKLINFFGGLDILSGSSVFIRDWYKYIFDSKNSLSFRENQKNNEKVIFLSGSLSNQTKRQIEKFITDGGEAQKLNGSIINEEFINQCIERIKKDNKNILFYSERENYKDNDELLQAAKKIEGFFSVISKEAYEIGIKNIVVAGGETSGAVVESLPFEVYKAIDVVDYGIPILESNDDSELKLILKSGNFGGDDFFQKSVSKLRKE